MANHDHVPGIFCDDCPDALRQNIKRILVEHQWANNMIHTDRDCTCGWSMPYKETHQHSAHHADVLSATLTDLGWVRAAPMIEQEAFLIYIDKRGFGVGTTTLTGAALRYLPTPPISPDYDLFRTDPTGEDTLVRDDEVVKVVAGTSFFTAPKQITAGATEGPTL